MRHRLRFMLAIGLLLLAAASAFLWLRSFHTSDWILYIHRQPDRVISDVGVATFDGIFLVYLGHGNNSGYIDAPNDTFQYNVQTIADPYVLLLSPEDWNIAGFGGHWLSEHTRATYRRRLHLIAPGWFISLAFAVPGVLLLRRARRLKHIAHLNLCVHCGYDLRATPDRCPECGAIPPPPAHQTPRESADVRPG